MKVGYARCSTQDQIPARQEEMLKDEGCEKIYLDMLSNKDTNRPQLKEMLGYVREGDQVVVKTISQLARNTKDFLTIVEQLNKKRCILYPRKKQLTLKVQQANS